MTIDSQTDKTVTARLKGGLGNQLFQYATAFALSKDQNRALVIDTGWFDRKRSNRAYRLDAFRVRAKTTSLSKSKLTYIKTLNTMGILAKGRRYHRLSDPVDLGFRSFDRDLPDHILLDGYWQASQYFAHHRPALLQALTFANDITVQFSPHELNNMVAVHIRRGDYMNSSAPHIVSEQFIHAAMAIFNNQYEFLICSDDVDWCKRTFANNNVHFSNGQSELEDLALMRSCAHNIIANSSFSWWAAWLNQNKQQRVIAPTPWTKFGMSHQDILPAHWETLPI